MTQVAEPFLPLRAIRHLEKGRVVIFAAGLGVPYFSTDTCAAQRALEITRGRAPQGHEGGRRLHRRPACSTRPRTGSRRSSYSDFLREGYGVMDATAVSLCMENKLPILVFNLRDEGNIRRVVIGEPIGTLVH